MIGRLPKERIEQLRTYPAPGKWRYRAVDELLGHIDAIEAELEQERVRLAGCGVAALGYDQDLPRDSYGWSASYGDVVRMRQQLEKELAEAKAEIVERTKDYDGALLRWKTSLDRETTLYRQLEEAKAEIARLQSLCDAYYHQTRK